MDISGNTVFVLQDWGQYHPPPSASKLGCNTDLRPTAVGPYCTPILRPPVSGMVLPPISQDSDGIPRYVLARLTVFYHFAPLCSPLLHFTIGVHLAVEMTKSHTDCDRSVVNEMQIFAVYGLNEQGLRHSSPKAPKSSSEKLKRISR